MFPKIKNWKAFIKRVELICYLIISAITELKPDEHLFSVDEKTGIQALERMTISPVSQGKIRKIEYEYKRHGTTCLMGALDVKTGKLKHHRIHPTRKEEDYVIFIDQLCTPIPATDKITMLADQLNIHKSATLVEWIAKTIGYKGDLGTKGYKGILKDQISRMEFLEDPDHRIRFVFTPVHCSWLNPIENWFGKLQSQRLNKASFTSVEELKMKMKTYIEYTNKWFAKPYKWKFKGFTKNRKLNTF